MLYRFGEFELNDQTRELRQRDRDPVVMQPLVFDLIALLVRNHARVVPKVELLDTLWPEGFGSEPSLQRVVSLARSALSDDTHALIRTFSGRGYRFCGDVRADATVRASPAGGQPSLVPQPKPRIRYATTSDGIRIGFTTTGTGLALIHILAPGGHIQQQWEVPEFVEFHSRVAQHRMLVHYDHRGTGLSQRNVLDFSLDTFLADLTAVADRLSLDRFALWGTLGMGMVAIAYAARHPERISRIVLWHSYARGSDWIRSPAVQALRRLADNWELHTDTLAHYTFGWPGGDAARRYAARMRDGVAQDTYRAMVAQTNRFDVSNLLPFVRAPTLVLHRRGFPLAGIEMAQDLAARIPDARLVLLEGESVGYALEDSESALRVIEEFLAEGEPKRG